MTKFRVIYNQKGGVGKTTLSVNLAACAAIKGFRTLLIDSDPQANSTAHLLGPDAVPEHTLADFYESCLGLNIFRQTLLQYVTKNTGVENLHLVACSRELEDLRNKLENKHKINKLKDGLRDTPYEHVYFDPPPANDFFSLSCLIAASEIIIPIDCDAFSVRAAKDIVATLEEVRHDHNPDLKVCGMVVNQYQKATKHSSSIIDELRQLGLPVLEPYIPSSVKIRESHSEALPLVVGHPTHSVSQALMSLFESLDASDALPKVKKRMQKEDSSRVSLEP